MTPQQLVNSEADWERSIQAELTLGLILEQGLLTPEQKLNLQAYNRPAYPLMHQLEVAHLRNIGPLLLDMTGQPFALLMAIVDDLGSENLCGWLSSELPAPDLAHHLGDAMACLDTNDSILMIRSYSPNVLPILYTHTEELWHQWLFTPIHSWWVINQQNWQHFIGAASASKECEYSPIKLNKTIVSALQHDALAVQLVEQLSQLAPEVFTSNCYGDRLHQVTKLLDTAREYKLNSDDQSTFVLYSLLENSPLHQRRNWHMTLKLVKSQNVCLESILSKVSDV